MADLITGIILALAVLAAIVFIRRQKKSGKTCGGCPHAGTCNRMSCACEEKKKQQ